MLDPEAEYRRVHERYAPVRPRDVVVMLLAAAAIFLASLFWTVDWWIFAGTVAAFIGWELTKFRLRRNAYNFVKRSI